MTNKEQPRIPTPGLWAKLRHLCGDIPAWVDELVERVEAEREVAGRHPNPAGSKGNTFLLNQECNITAPATEAAKQWDGWGTALKPSFEPICVARKPFKGNVAENVLEWGCGGINVDGCRVGTEQTGARASNKDGIARRDMAFGMKEFEGNPTVGRWPANLIHDGSDEVVELFPETTSQQRIGNRPGKSKGCLGAFTGQDAVMMGHTDSGSAARFFYCAKASRSDRGSYNNHPTVKPIDLMRYLCRLVTPPGGTVLDLFAGSCSTGRAAMLEGFKYILIEKDPQWVEVGERRIKETQPPLPMTMEARA